MRLFEENKYKISLSPEVRQISEFKNVWSRDRGGKIPGDSDGREKLYAIAELSYVHFQCYYKSPYGRFDGDDKHIRLVRDLKLPDGWKPDATVKAAMDKYIELQDTPATYMAMELNMSLTSSTKIVKILRERLENRIATALESNTLEHDDLKPLLNDLDTIVGIAAKVPKLLKDLKIINIDVENEQSEKNRIKGNLKITKYQTADRNNHI